MRIAVAKRRVCCAATRSAPPQHTVLRLRRQSSKSLPNSKLSENNPEEPDSTLNPPPAVRKTIAEADAELRSRLEAMSGDGGAAGVEYENGSAEGLKSEVKRNMFRLI